MLTLKITQNLSAKSRVLYLALGLALVAMPFVIGLTGWWRIGGIMLGLATIAGGASGI